MLLPSDKARRNSTRSWQRQGIYTYLLLHMLIRSTCVEYESKKLFIRCSEVKVVKVSHIKGLEVPSILQFAYENENIRDYLPEYDYTKEPNREWIWNIVNTLSHEKFQEFILSKISLREAELTKSKNLNVRAIPEIVDIIKKSRAVSICKGKSHFLLRSVVKRKSKKQAELEEKKEKEQREYVSELKYKLDEMKGKIQ